MRVLLLSLVLFMSLWPVRPEAQQLPQVQTEEEFDAGAARAAVLRGEMLSLERILVIVRQRFPGEIIEIELELEDGAPVYEFGILGPDGRLFEVEIDAATGKVLDIDDDDD